MEGILMLAWFAGFIVSLIFLIENIIGYRNKKKTKKPVIIFAVLTFVLGLPVILLLVLIIGLSTGLVGM